MVNRTLPATFGARSAGVAALLALVWLVMLAFGAGALDRGVLLALYARDEPSLALAAIGLTKLGDWWTVVAVTVSGGLWLLYKGDRWAALTLIAISFGGRLLVILQKDYFARLRPEEDMRLVDVHYLSFPSGHAANSMIAYLALALLIFDQSRHRKVAASAAILLSLLVGLSRPMLGVHWPSDVIAGWAFGLLWVMVCLALAQTLKRKSSTSPSWTT